jgi:hypothetical protein
MTPRQLLLRILGALILLVSLVYAGDYLSVRIRMRRPSPADPFESLTRTRVLAIPEKNGKTEYQIDAQRPTETLTCVHSLFPHFGYAPCWKLKPHINDPIPMTICLPGDVAVLRMHL